MKLKFETKGFVKDIEIDGGAVMNSLIVTYMWVQMGFPTGVFGVRSQHLHEENSKAKNKALINETTPRGRTSGPR